MNRLGLFILVGEPFAPVDPNKKYQAYGQNANCKVSGIHVYIKGEQKDAVWRGDGFGKAES